MERKGMRERRSVLDEDDLFTRIAVDNVSVPAVPVPPGVVLAGLGMVSYVVGSGMIGRDAGRRSRTKDELA